MGEEALPPNRRNPLPARITFRHATAAREVEVEVLPKSQPVRPGHARVNDPIVAMVARLMDTLFVIPGTKIRFGLDPIIGLIPGIGSPASAFVSLLMIARSAQHGVPNSVLARMGLNVLINAILDAVPVAGDFLSVFYRSNARNHELLLQHAGTRRRAGVRDWLFVLGLLAGLVLFVVILIVGALTVAAKLWALVTH